MGVLIGTMSLGQAMPNLEYISSARGAASAVWEIIDLVRGSTARAKGVVGLHFACTGSLEAGTLFEDRRLK